MTDESELEIAARQAREGIVDTAKVDPVGDGALQAACDAAVKAGVSKDAVKGLIGGYSMTTRAAGIPQDKRPEFLEGLATRVKLAKISDAELEARSKDTTAGPDDRETADEELNRRQRAADASARNAGKAAEPTKKEAEKAKREADASAAKERAEGELTTLAISITAMAKVADEYAETVCINHKASQIEIAMEISKARDAFTLVYGKRVDGNYKWEDWCNEHIPTRSKSAISKLLRLGNAGDKSLEAVAAAYEKTNQDRRLRDALNPNTDVDGEEDSEEDTNSNDGDPLQLAADKVLAAYAKLAPEARPLVFARIAEDPTSRGSDTIPEEARRVVLDGLRMDGKSGLFKPTILKVIDGYLAAGGPDGPLVALLREAMNQKTAAKPKAKKAPAAEEHTTAD